MIYLISDLHGEIDFPALWKYVNIATEDDLLIILGDVGLSFENTEENKRFTERFLSIKKNIAIIDGNHENFEYLNSFPEEEWNGGMVGRLTDSIILLKRGSIYDIEDKTFFVFGGCKSSPKWKEMGLWHYGEEPEKAELEYAYDNLEKYNYSVDYILTHKYEETHAEGTVCEDLQKLAHYIEENVSYKKWYAGHWHICKKKDEKHYFVYDKLEIIE